MEPDYPTEIHPFTNRWFNFNRPALSDEAKSAWVINEEKQYFGLLPNRQIKHLVVGSFPIWASVHNDPPHTGFDFAFFYCSRMNGFFKILGKISGYDFFPNPIQTTPFQKTQAVANLFLNKQIGITDIIKQVRRTDANCCASDDESLEAVSYNSLLILLRDYPAISDIYFTSGKVHKWFNAYLRKSIGVGQIRKNFFVERLGRHVKTHTIISPANTANVSIAGNLNKDDRSYNEKDRLRKHMLKIPFVLDLPDEKDRYRVVQWAKHLKSVPNLVRPEILNHPSFIAIEDRL